LALVVLSVVEQRLDAVRAVLDGAQVTEVAARMGVHRSTVHRWVDRYLAGQVGGLADRSHRPHSSPRQAAELVEAAVAEMRREHPRCGSRRIRLEMLRKPGPWARQTAEIPSERTIDRILHRRGLARARPRKRPRESYVLLRTRPSPITPDQAARLRGARPAGPPPHASAGPVRVQRRASATGVIMVAGQKIALGRTRAGQTVTVLASDTTLTIKDEDGETQIIGRTTTQPVRSVKAQRPRALPAPGQAAR
jgi:transposase-like protein